MAMSQPPDAIFVANDYMAFAVLDTLRETLAVAVPGDVSVIGFDDVPQAAWAAYSLSTVGQPTDAMIDATVSVLFEQLDSGHAVPRHQCLPVELIQRGTTPATR